MDTKTQCSIVSSNSKESNHPSYAINFPEQASINIDSELSLVESVLRKNESYDAVVSSNQSESAGKIELYLKHNKNIYNEFFFFYKV